MPGPTTASSSSASSPPKASWQWTRALARTVAGSPDRSPFVDMTSGQRSTFASVEPVVYELDGGDRAKTKRMKVTVEPAAITVCVPSDAPT